MGYTTIGDMLAALQELIDLDAAGGLTPWEREFIEDVYGKYRRRPSLSDKQRYRIEQIYKEQFGEDEDV